MFSSHAPQRLLLIGVLLAAQLGGCASGWLSPAPFGLTVEGVAYEVRRYPFLSRGGFGEIAPVAVRPAALAGFASDDAGRALARQVLERYCAWFGFDPGPPDTSYWTTDGAWHFVQGCLRPV